MLWRQCSGALFPKAFGIFKMYIYINTTVERRNPAPVDMVNYPRFYTSRWLAGFLNHQQYYMWQWQYHHALDAAEIRKARGKTYNMGVSENRGTPKWMVYNGNPIKMDDFGVPLFSETSIWNNNFRSLGEMELNCILLRLACDAGKCTSRLKF